MGVLAGAVVALTLLTGCQTGDSIAGVGSDTTFDVVGALATAYNGGSTNGGDRVFNVPPTAGPTYTVPADSKCGAVSYPPTPRPNGSSAGITALINDTQGCVDFARSSRGRSGTDPATLEFYAFARDAVSWAHFTSACPGGDVAPAGCAPSNLTQAQLKGIYLCDQPGGLPKFTNWSQVGGDNEPIRRFLPQAGSGTLSFFETRILGLTSAQQGVLDDTACATAPGRVQENSGSAIPAAERFNSIVPYSYAQYTAQASGTVPDLRAGSVLGSINGVAPTATTIGNGTFLGVRYVYNVLKTTSPSYSRALNFAGLSGYVCSDAATASISAYGFVPLTPLSGSRCRKDPAPL